MNKIIVKTILVIGLAFIICPLYAEMIYLESGLHQNFGLEFYHYHYIETNENGGFFMKDKGLMHGIYYDAAFQPKNTAFRFGIDVRTAYGANIHYHSNGTGDAKHCRYKVFEGRLLGSYVVPLQNQWATEGYVGIGLRYLINYETPFESTTGHVDYRRCSQYNYVPIGVRIIKELQNEMQWLGYVEYDWFLSGLQTSFSQYYSAPIKNRQRHGYGARAGMDLKIPSSKFCFDYTLGIFIRYWHIGKSEILALDKLKGGVLIPYDVWEPRNTTKEIGIRIGLAF